MTDLVLPESKIVSLDEARGAKDARKAMVREKDFCTIQQAGVIAGGVGQKVYELVAEQHAEQMGKLEAMCIQRIEAMEMQVRDLERRTWRGRWRAVRLWWNTRRANW